MMGKSPLKFEHFETNITFITLTSRHRPVSSFDRTGSGLILNIGVLVAADIDIIKDEAGAIIFIL